jgi:TonB family protein
MSPNLPEVYTAGEIARAAGVSKRDVQTLVEAGLIEPLDGERFFSTEQAAIAVRHLANAPAASEHALFRPAAGVRRRPAMPLALSSSLHVGMAALVALVTSLGMAHPQARVIPRDSKELRMVFLMAPGPGGGGGGGGHKELAPPPPAERKAPVVKKTLRSPLPVRRPPPRIDPPPVVKPVDPPPQKAEPLPAVIAPVVPVPADPRDRAGLPFPKESAQDADSHGQGDGGGTGSGHGTGLGEGDGAGIGRGSGGGTGGGPYRPGAGITPPSILREVKPDYTDEGRRRNLAGDVVLEIVVRSDGSVGSVKVLQGLGAGLDQRAADAVRQWRFNPARRYGTPVDVVVEVAVEFKLR